MNKDWTIDGFDGEPIIGTTHQPSGDPRGTIYIAHGFKGYKDYGMFPRVAATCADAGFVAHRFNFSHSGMTANTATFERPDLFELDTWNKQVFDYLAVMQEFNYDGLPFVMFGHSRGGVTALLTAGRHAVPAAGVVTAAAPSSCNSLTDEMQSELLNVGFLLSPSARTGQDLKVGRAFVDEQVHEPDAHDLPAVAARIKCPVLLVHGESDPTVPASCAAELAAVIDDATVTIVEGADHVFNTPNPLPDEQPSSPQLQTLLDALTTFSSRFCG